MIGPGSVDLSSGPAEVASCGSTGFKQGEDVKVRSYGKLADLLGAERQVHLTAPCTVAELRALLANECPDAAEALANKRVLACVDDAIVPDSHVIARDESVDLLAPVSGG